MRDYCAVWDTCLVDVYLNSLFFFAVYIKTYQSKSYFIIVGFWANLNDSLRGVSQLMEAWVILSLRYEMGADLCLEDNNDSPAKYD